MRTIEYKGVTVEYDERCVLSYKWQKAMNSNDPHRSVDAISRLFCGKDEDIADALCGNDDHDELDSAMDAMADLLKAVLEDMGRVAKN